MKQIFFVVTVATLMSACNGTAPVSSPIAPSPSNPSVPAPSQPTYTLSGVITEATPNGRVPVEGVLVEEVECNRQCAIAAQAATTDSKGFYRLSEFPASQARYLWVSKKGYRADEISLTIATDTRLDIELVRQ